MRRADAGYTYHFGVDSEIAKDDESETGPKTNRGPRVHPLFASSLLFTCKEHVQSPLTTCKVSTRMHTHIYIHTYIQTHLANKQ